MSVIYPDIIQTVEDITPKKAIELLELNTHNRPIIKGLLGRLVHAIKIGEYQFNGESIKISKNGVLMDGQHRLKAIVETNSTLKMAVIYGLEDQAFITLDQGAPRQLDHILSMEHVKNSTLVAAMIPLIMNYDLIGRPGKHVLKGSRRYTKEEFFEYFKAHPDIEHSARFVATLGRVIRAMPVTSWGFCHYIFARIDAAAANQYLRKLAYGADVGTTEFIVRERLLKLSMAIEKMPAD